MYILVIFLRDILFLNLTLTYPSILQKYINMYQIHRILINFYYVLYNTIIYL